MSTEKDNLDKAKSIWKTLDISWGILSWAKLTDAAADFILTFSQQIKDQPPTPAQMMVIAFRWNKLSPSERKTKVDQSRLTEVRQAAPVWDPIVLMDSQPDDVEAADKIIAAYLPVVMPPSPKTGFSGPIKIAQPSIPLTRFGEPIAIPTTSVETPKDDDADKGKKPNQTPPTASLMPSTPSSAPEIADLSQTEPDFALSIPNEEKLRRQEFQGFLTRTNVDMFKKEVDGLLADEDFDPAQKVPNSQINYIQHALELRDEAEKLFSMPINNREDVWTTIHNVILDLNSRVEDLLEKKYPTTVSKYEYIFVKAKKGTETVFSKKEKEQRPEIEIAKLGPISLFCCTAQDSFEGHHGNSSYGQDAVGVRQILGPTGEINGYQLIQADGVGQGFRSEFLTKFLVNLLLKSPVTGERFLHTIAAGFQDLLSMEGIGDIPDMLALALKKQMRELGSATTINQMAIGVDGKTGGSFRGDGILGVVRSNGEVKVYPFGSAADTLKTKKPLGSKIPPFENYQGKALSIKDVTDGEEIILNEGDCLLLSSDGLEHNTKKFERIAELLSSGLSGTELEDKIAEIFWEEELIPDDKGLIIYHHKKIS